jgi:hypothetical protein
MPRHRHIGRSRAARALVALVAVCACLGSVAYAATRPESELHQLVHPADRQVDAVRVTGERSRIAAAGKAPSGKTDGPPRPEFIEVPPASVVGDGYQFRFHVSPPPQPAGKGAPAPAGAPARRWRRFLCRLDGGEWVDCASPRILPELDPGDHTFAVRALSPGGSSGAAAYYRWSQLQPMAFTVEPRGGSLEDLMPGAPAQPLPVRVGNPNPVPIEVTGLTVAVEPAPPGCPADPNFAVTPAALTPAAPLGVPAGGSADLPPATAPALALRELPSDQNACQGATVHLVFSGEARG